MDAYVFPIRFLNVNGEYYVDCLPIFEKYYTMKPIKHIVYIIQGHRKGSP